MYYHIRIDKIDKILHDGRTDMEARVAWDFRSLKQALAMIARDFGSHSAGWRIQDLQSPADKRLDIMQLKDALQEALESSYQYIVMTFKDDDPLTEKYDHYEFFVVARDESESPVNYSFSIEEENAIAAPKVLFEPNVMRSLTDILLSFAFEGKFNAAEQAFKVIYEFYDEEEDVPDDIKNLKGKDNLTVVDYILLADECLSCGEEQLAAGLYAAACCSKDLSRQKGEAFVKLADLYMNSDWPRKVGREWDVMKAIDLLTEALKLGCIEEAKTALEGMREQIFEEFDDEPDVNYFIGHYRPDALCLAAFCLAFGIGWQKDVSAAIRLNEAAFKCGYDRAAYYLDEIQVGHIK